MSHSSDGKAVAKTTIYCGRVPRTTLVHVKTVFRIFGSLCAFVREEQPYGVRRRRGPSPTADSSPKLSFFLFWLPTTQTDSLQGTRWKRERGEKRKEREREREREKKDHLLATRPSW